MEGLRYHLEKVLYEEALARCKYELYAEVARVQGLHYYAKVLEETSRNELSHVRELMRMLDRIGTTGTNLRDAIEGERIESEELYPFIASQAIADGELNIGRFFNQIAKIEQGHKERFEALKSLLDEGNVYERDRAIIWKCRVCGYVHDGTQPPQKCPGCQNSQNVFEPADFAV